MPLMDVELLPVKKELGEYGDTKKCGFYPYDENNGSIAAIAHDNFVVIASDTRLTMGYSILTREQSKLFTLSRNVVLGSTGCWCDVLTLTKVIEARMKMYLHEHNSPMSAPAVAQMLATLLYYKRFFPYYTSNVLAGIDENGKGCVFAYDPVGCIERVPYACGGASTASIEPLLDNQIGLKNIKGAKASDLSITKEKAASILKDAFISAAERDTPTGDGVHIVTITSEGISEETFPLRRD